MEELIDSNENGCRFDEQKEIRKLNNNNNNNNNNNDLAPTAPISLPQCLNCPNGADHEDSSPGQQSVESFAFHNEGLIQEIFQLPNMSDEEASSSSDNCVYAYRGVGTPEPVQAPCADDETDFLEMDFDPEPNSEIENFNDEHFNHLEANFFQLQHQCNNEVTTNNTPEPLQQLQQEQSCEIHHVPPTMSLKETGAKPKQPKQINVSRSPVIENPSESIALLERDSLDEELHCLDCAEIEFLRQTKPEISGETRCPNHRVRQSSSSKKREEPLVVVSPTSIIKQHVTEAVFDDVRNREFMVTIYSVGCNYETIVEAINSIRVTMHTEAIKSYFDAILDEETSTMSVPEYLLYISKRGCNYKKVMELIRTNCIEPIDIHFYPVDPLTRVPETIQICASEINSRWNPNTDLRQILRFKNRQFRYMNILGKVIHVLRQPERNRQTTIDIPQYYKSGYICITRSRPWTT